MTNEETLMGTEIVKQDDNSLVQYGKKSEIEALATRIKILMPGNQAYTLNEAFMLAQLAISHDLDPFNGEVWLIKNANTGKVLGSLIGLKGLRKHAKRQSEYWGVGGDGGFVQIIDEEQKKLLNANPGDLVFSYTISDTVTMTQWIKGLRSLIDAKFDQNEAHKMMGERPTTRGIGIYKSGEATKMKPAQCAMFRAEKDCLKRRFDVRFEVHDPTDGVDLPASTSLIEAHENSLPPTTWDKPKGPMMGFDVDVDDEPSVPSESAEVLDLEFEDDIEPDQEPVEPTAFGVPIDELIGVEEVVEKSPENVIDDGISKYDAKTGLRLDTPSPAETVVEIFEPEPDAEPSKAPKSNNKPEIQRPYPPQDLKSAVDDWAGFYKAPCTDDNRKMLAATLTTVFEGDKEKRYTVCLGLTGFSSTSEIPDNYVQALLGTWLEVTEWGKPPSNVSILEAKSYHTYAQKLFGQKEFDLGKTQVEE